MVRTTEQGYASGTGIQGKSQGREELKAARPTREEIELAAYHRWNRDGGDAQSNWIAAERDLLQSREKTGRPEIG